MMDKKRRHLLTGILSYLCILVLVPLLLISPRQRDDFIRFHLRQGLALFFVELIAWLLFEMLIRLPLLGLPFSALWSVLQFVFLIVTIVAIVQAVKGKRWKIPFVSEFSGMFNLR